MAEVRVFQKSDLDAVFALLVQPENEFFLSFTPDKKKYLRGFINNLRQGNGDLYVYVEAEKIIACVFTCFNRGELYQHSFLLQNFAFSHAFAKQYTYTGFINAIFAEVQQQKNYITRVDIKCASGHKVLIELAKGDEYQYAATLLDSTYAAKGKLKYYKDQVIFCKNTAPVTLRPDPRPQAPREIDTRAYAAHDITVKAITTVPQHISEQLRDFISAEELSRIRKKR